MKTYLNILIILLTIILCSCSTSYYVSKKNDLFQTKARGDHYSTIKFRLDDIKSKKVVIEEKKGYLTVSFPDKTETNLDEDTIITNSGNLQGFRDEIEGSSLYYFPAKEDFGNVKSFIYHAWDLKLIAATISIKHRYKTRDFKDPSIQASFPSTFSTGFAPTLALGGSRTIHWFTPNAKKYELGFTLGAFYGVGTTKIDKNTTRETPYQYSRTSLYHSFGGFFNIGFQKFDIGIVCGFDHATGPGSPRWVYQNQCFYGIIVGYDIVKFQK